MSMRRWRRFELVESKHTIRNQVLDCMWVFTYKTDSDGYLVKCEARLVVCGNQQEVGELPTRATTLASSAFKSMMALVAKYELETRQLDAVNAFVNCPLEEVVYMSDGRGYHHGHSSSAYLRRLYHGDRDDLRGPR